MATLAGQRVIVAGGYGGLGSAICDQLSEQGALIAIAGRSKDRAEVLAARLRARGTTAISAYVEVSSADSVGRMVDEVAGQFSGLDALVNYTSMLATGPTEKFPESEFREIVETNLTGAFLLSREAGRLFIDTGHPGRLVHMSSVRGTAGGRRGFAAYGASKAGLDLLVKQLATEWGRHGITVNAVAPGFVRTEFVQDATEDTAFIQMLKQRIPLGRLAEPAEVASAVLYLLSPLARFMTGQVLYVDGGVTASQ